jgi:hypothetical protein
MIGQEDRRSTLRSAVARWSGSAVNLEVGVGGREVDLDLEVRGRRSIS